MTLEIVSLKETLNKFLFDQNVGLAIADIIHNSGIRTDAGATTTHIPLNHFQYPLSKSHTVFTNVDHGLNGIKKVSIASSGGGYGTGGSSDRVIYYNAQLVNSADLGFPTVNDDGNANAVGVGSTTGLHATARVTVDKNQGGITAIAIADPGSAFGIGNGHVTGIGTHTSSVGTGHSAAKITVEKVNNNIGDVHSKRYFGNLLSI